MFRFQRFQALVVDPANKSMIKKYFAMTSNFKYRFYTSNLLVVITSNYGMIKYLKWSAGKLDSAYGKGYMSFSANENFLQKFKPNVDFVSFSCLYLHWIRIDDQHRVFYRSLFIANLHNIFACI